MDWGNLLSTRIGVLFLSIVTVATAVSLGLLLAPSVRHIHENAVQKRTTRVELNRMQTLNIGDTLPDVRLEDLSGRSIDLASVIKHRRTAIAFVLPDCDACLFEMQRILKLSPDSIAQQHWVLVSSSNPRTLNDLKVERGLAMPVLYDHQNRLASRLRINSFPFNIVVDSQRVIISIFSGALLDDQVSQIASEN
jgi:peroxiredoxin